jgi:hypothetical protein
MPTTTYADTGMTCAHAVSGESYRRLGGVTDVTADPG